MRRSLFPSLLIARAGSMSFALVAFAAQLSILGCGNEPTPPSSNEPIDQPDAPVCVAPGDSYMLGIAKTSDNGMTVSIEDANPAPPGLGKNQWRVKVKDAAGNRIVGATMSLTLYMPLPHDHMQPGTLGIDRGDGSYDLSDINLVMPGLFNVTILVTPAGGRMDKVVFQFCVERKGG